MDKEKTILGIDPGYDRLGVALVTKKDKEDLIFSDCLTSNNKESFPERLFSLGKQLEEIIKKYKPKALALEKVFVSNNQKTAMMIGEVRGMIMFIAQKNNLPVFDYTPLEIKNTVTGFGGADKKQVQKMVEMLVSINKKIKYDDEFDAIAVALTALARQQL